MVFGSLKFNRTVREFRVSKQELVNFVGWKVSSGRLPLETKIHLQLGPVRQNKILEKCKYNTPRHPRPHGSWTRNLESKQSKVIFVKGDNFKIKKFLKQRARIGFTCWGSASEG